MCRRVQFYELAVQFNKPMLIFVNKLDKENADFDRAVASIRKTLTKKAHPVAIPIMAGTSVRVPSTSWNPAPLHLATSPRKSRFPPNRRKRPSSPSRRLWEEVAGNDDALFEKIASGESVSKEEILPHLVKAIASREIVPIIGGTAVPPQGPSLLLDTMCRLMPSPLALPPPAQAEGEPSSRLRWAPISRPCAQVFRVTSDPGVGELYFFALRTARFVQATICSIRGIRIANESDT